MDVDLAGFFGATPLSVAPMPAAGRVHVVQITTTLVEQPLVGVPSGVAIEDAARCVQVNAVATGIIRTAMKLPVVREVAEGPHPMGRRGEVEGCSTASARAP